MKELRFHRELYAGEAIDEATKVYDRFATFELEEQPSYWVVRLTDRKPAREPRLVHEFGNYVLGLTIKRGGVAT